MMDGVNNGWTMGTGFGYYLVFGIAVLVVIIGIYAMLRRKK